MLQHCLRGTLSITVWSRERQWNWNFNQAVSTDFDIDRRQFTADILSQYASLAKEARKSGQLHVALGCINSMAKVGQVST